MYTPILSVGITADRTTATVIDGTVYGGSEPARNLVLVFLTGDKRNADNTIASVLTLTPNDTDPTIVSSWSYDYTSTGDGWVNYFFVIISDIYDSGTTYDIYDAVYDSSTKLVYRSKIDANLGNVLSDTNSWELITDPSSLALNKDQPNESLNISSIVYQRVLTFNSQYGYGNFVSENASGCCGDCGDTEAVATYSLLSLLVNGAIQADYQTLLPQGQVIVERIAGILSTC